MKNSTDLKLGGAIGKLILFHFPDFGLISTCIHFHYDRRVRACTTKPQCKDCPLITYAGFGSDIKTCWKEEPRRNTYTCDEYAEIGQLNRSTKIPGFLEIVETKGEKRIKIMEFNQWFKTSACATVLRGSLFTLFRQSSLCTAPSPQSKSGKETLSSILFEGREKLYTCCLHKRGISLR